MNKEEVLAQQFGYWEDRRYFQRLMHEQEMELVKLKKQWVNIEIEIVNNERDS